MRILLAAICFFISVPMALAQSRAAIEAAADMQLANDFVFAITGGVTGVPGVEAATGASIAAHLLDGDIEAAAKEAQDWVEGAALDKIAGGSASAIMTAMALGEQLGHATHEWAGEARLVSEFKRLGGIRGLQGWPRSYAKALEDGFLGPVLETRIRPVALWLRDRDGGQNSRFSEAYFERLAYQMILGMRDLELGYARFDLQGDARTPEALAAAVEAEKARAVAEALGRRDAILWMQDTMKAEAERQAAERAVQDAKQALKVADEEARTAAQETLRKAEAAEAEAARSAESAQAALNESRQGAVSHVLPPLPLPAADLLTITLERVDRLGADISVLHLKVTNNGDTTIPALHFGLGPQRQPAGGGVAWGSGPVPAALAPRESLPLTVAATGEIGAVIVTLAAMGATVTTAIFPVDHLSMMQEPIPSGEAIALPAVFEGNGEGVHRLEAGGQSASAPSTYAVRLFIDTDGAWEMVTQSRSQYVYVAPTDPPGGVRLLVTPATERETRLSGTVAVDGNSTTTEALTAALRKPVPEANDPRVVADHQIKVSANRIVFTSRTRQVVPTGKFQVVHGFETEIAVDLLTSRK